MSDPNSAPPRAKHKISILKWFLAWLSIGLGLLTIVAGLMSPPRSSIIIGIAFALPGAWFIMHEQRSEKAAAAGAPQLKRHWGWVAVAVVALIIIGGILTPETEEETEEASTPTTTSATPSSTTRSPETSTRATSSARETTSSSEPTSSTTTRAPEPSSADAPAGVGFAGGLGGDAPERAAVPEPAAPAEEAPAAAYYPNCSAARAAGAAPLYAGSPGYSRSLDRDGDGVACE